MFRSDDDGASWQALPLERKHDELNAYYAAYQNPMSPNGTDESSVYREAMAADNGDPTALYLGTSQGEIYQTFDGREEWTLLASGLPSVRLVRPAVP